MHDDEQRLCVRAFEEPELGAPTDDSSLSQVLESCGRRSDCLSRVGRLSDGYDKPPGASLQGPYLA